MAKDECPGHVVSVVLSLNKHFYRMSQGNRAKAHYPKFTGLLTRRYGPLQDDCPVNLDNQKFMARVNMQHKCKIMSYHEIYRIFVLQKIVVHFVRLNQYVVAPHRETPAVGNNIA